MKLIVISPSKKQENEVPFLINMFEQGLPTYHIRKKTFSTRQLKELIESIPKKYHNRLVIHSHHELALKYNLKGIYISRSHKKRKIRLWFFLNWLKLRKSNLQVSVTFRSIENVYDFNPRYDYIFLAPIFDTLSGNFQSAFSDYNLRPTLKNSKYNIIARGGISADTIQKAAELGFKGLAFYSSIWKSAQPVLEFTKAKQKFKELGLPLE